MEAKELRIGNLVLNKHDEIHEIGINDYMKFFFPLMDGRGFKPIEISEEWLLKFRFVKDDFCSLYIRYTLNNITIIHDTKNNTFLADGIKYKLVYLKYVHQLQNLYFCLCGKELELSNQNVM